MEVQDFVEAFNTQREDYFEPSEFICVYESMSRPYGLGGGCIYLSHPQYFSIQLKPENMCELQNATYGQRGIMIRVEIFMSVEETQILPFEQEYKNVFAVLNILADPWFSTNKAVVADSYFASVHAAQEIYKHVLSFIGVVKNNYRCHPMGASSNSELQLKERFLLMSLT